MPTDRSLSYEVTGVLHNTQLGLGGLLHWVNKTATFREGQRGQRVVDVGFFASVVDIGNGLGLALCTDGVGSKVLIAEMLDRYDTIGIDCVAMNVNDAICVGAEPISFLDYIALERATPRVLRIILGKHVAAGDIIIGVRSSGIHSNGLTLARRALLDEGKLKADQYLADLGRTVGEELLLPTHIYVRPVVDLVFRQQLPIRALVNVTSGGFLNLARIDRKVGFRIDNLPDPHPIFGLIQQVGLVPAREMYQVFNMGIGFCLIVEDKESIVSAVKQTFEGHNFETHTIGKVIDDERKRVFLPKQGLVGEGETFTHV